MGPASRCCDALTLNNWLWWEDRRRELYWLKTGRARGLFLSQIGAQVGVGKRGVIDRVDRLEALLRHDRPDEKITRAARRAAREADKERSAQDVWIAEHHEQLASIITGLVAEADRYELEDDEREWIDELASDARSGELRSATMVVLGLAIDELRTTPAVLALDSTRPHRVHTLGACGRITQSIHRSDRRSIEQARARLTAQTTASGGGRHA